LSAGKTNFLTSQQNAMSKRNIHVVPHGDTWAVRTEGNQRVTVTAPTQAAAAAIARGMGIQREGEVFIHRPDGRIRDRNSYGNDPASSKG
jgi:hypothetical protein